jgi:DNA end-binding protein Ku
MRPIWKGSISFGLVNIPITLYPAIRREELKFHLLRASDFSPINYKRVAEADGKEVPWDKIVKGYEYEKGKFAVLKDEDFRRIDVEATQTVVIESFVELSEVNPTLFQKPYYMEPQKGADRAYVLLRDALADSGKIGVARVVIKTRRYLAAVKPQEKGLMLELMHFPDEMVDVSEFRTPTSVTPHKKELEMARTLIKGMAAKWDPEAYKDDYHEDLEKIIEAKIKAGGEEAPPPPKAKRPAAKIIDLMSVLQESVEAATKGKSQGKTAAKQTTHRKRKAG